MATEEDKKTDDGKISSHLETAPETMKEEQEKVREDIKNNSVDVDVDDWLRHFNFRLENEFPESIRRSRFNEMNSKDLTRRAAIDDALKVKEKYDNPKTGQKWYKSDVGKLLGMIHDYENSFFVMMGDYEWIANRLLTLVVETDDSEESMNRLKEEVKEIALAMGRRGPRYHFYLRW